MIKILKFEFVWNFGDFLNQRGNKISQKFYQISSIQNELSVALKKWWQFFWDMWKCTIEALVETSCDIEPQIQTAIYASGVNALL